MPSGVGAARQRVARVVFAAVLALAGLALAVPAADAQAAPTGGLQIDKIEIGGLAPATFAVTGPDGFSAARAVIPTQEGVASSAPPVLALPPGTYQIQETAPIDPTDSGLSAWDLTDVTCDGQFTQLNSSTVEVVVGEAVVTCTFTDEISRAATLGRKVVTGDTSSWVRPAIFHITCSGADDFEVDMDLPPVGPGGPGVYSIGQGSLPPATCTIAETDTGSDGPVTVSMVMTNHGVPIATGTTSLTFTTAVGDDLVLTVRNAFAPLARPELPEQGTTSTTAGGSTTTTTASTTTTTTTGGGGGVTTTVPGGGSTSVAPTTAPTELPTTGSPTGGMIVAALLAMIVGVVLVARTRRLAD